MFTPEMMESVKKVEATRASRLGTEPRRMTAEEKDQLLREFHPDYRAEAFEEIKVGPNKGQKANKELVHTSLKRIGYVCGGAQTVVEALMEAVGPDGTIMMPTQSWKNLDPETGVHWEADEQDRDLIRENWPAYDKRLTPTNTMGAVAELFRQLPGSIRSDHPARSVCAAGKYIPYYIYVNMLFLF